MAESNNSLAARTTALLVAVMQFALLSSGCASGPPRIMSAAEIQAAGDPRLEPSDITNVAITDEDRTRVDDVFLSSKTVTMRVQTGPIWARVFIGDISTAPLFRITDARIVSKITAAGFAGRMEYIVDGTLDFDGRQTPIHAEGSIGYAMDLMGAIREAIELGIADAARRVASVQRLALAAPRTTSDP